MAERSVPILLMLAAFAPMVLAQPELEAVPPESPDDAIELYLAERGLDGLRAAQLRARLLDATGDARIALAERLGAIYMRQISESPDPAFRAEVLRKSEELLDQVPAVDSFELRINLAKVRYLRARNAAERHRVRLAQPAEVDEARLTFEIILAELGSIADRASRQVRGLEGRESRGGEDLSEIRRRLATARRVRSLASYYSGWSGYYLWFLTGRSDLLHDAIEQFGVLLNADGRAPTLERIPRSLLRYEHVAWAATGVALCRSAQGDHVPAGLWLDEVEAAESLPEAVRSELFAYRLLVLAGARRWDSVAVLVDQQRRRTGGAEPALDLEDARLLAVLTLDAVRDLRQDAPARWQVDPLIQVALADLVDAGEIAHVMDLVNTYGTLPLGDAGFIPRYITAINAYNDARAAHEQAGDADDPTQDPDIKLRYREAAGLFTQAVEAEDAERFGTELGNAGFLRGLAWFFRGDFELAVNDFEAAAAFQQPPDQRERALRLMVLTLERMVESGDDSARARRDEAAAVYLQQFPRTEHAVRLLLRLTDAELMPDAAKADVLLGLAPESPLYVPARRQAAKLLYRACRLGTPEERAGHTARFLRVAEEQVETERERLVSGTTEEAEQAAVSASLLLRQILDLLFLAEVPDLDRAEDAISALEDIRVRAAGIEIGPRETLDQEILLRRLQVASWRGRGARVEDYYTVLRAAGGKYAELATSFLFHRADEIFDGADPNEASARRLVRVGADYLSLDGAGGVNLERRGGDYAAGRVASAAAYIWTVTGETDARDLARRLDRAATEAGLINAERLRRFAALSEQAEATDEALEAWRLLSAGYPDAAEAWYEARYNVIRLLADADPTEARRVLDQHSVLYPEYGPEPWGELIRALDRKVPRQLQEGGTP